MIITGRGVLAPDGESDVTALFDDLPTAKARVLADFDVRAELGRKGTSTFDRTTALTVVACGRALRAAGLDPLAADPARIGLVLGTTVGSLNSTMDFSHETFVQDRPYLVNPTLFPNTVMNCAAGQAAIWHGLRGVNATVAGGPPAFLQALRYAVRALERGRADTLLVGAVEEYAPCTAWARALTPGPPAAEAATVFVLRHPDPAGAAAPAVLSVAAGFDPAGPGDALAHCVRRAMRLAGAGAGQVWAVATGDRPGENAEYEAVAAALGHRPLDLSPAAIWQGDYGAATGGLALSALLDHQGDAPRGSVALITGHTPEGALAAAVIRPGSAPDAQGGRGPDAGAGDPGGEGTGG